MPFFEQRVAGVCAATLTPLTERLAPDHAALIDHCRRLLANGCDAINLLGTTGEATSLSTDARIGVMRAIAASDLPVSRFMVGTGAAAFDDALRLTRSAIDLGFAGALVIPPFYFKAIVDDGAFRYYARLIDAIADDRLRVYLYHFPQLSGFGFSPALVARLVAAYPSSIAGLKDSSGTPGYAQSIVAACPSIDVFPSSETVLAGARASGFAGCISATLNISAPLAGRVWRGAASDAQVASLGAVRAAIVKHQIVPALRYALASVSGDDGWLRVIPPLIELDPVAGAKLLAELEREPAFAAVREMFACA